MTQINENSPENSTPNADAVREVMQGDTDIRNVAGSNDETAETVGKEGDIQPPVAEVIIPDRAVSGKNFVWNQDNIRLLLSTELLTDLAQVRSRPPYNIWVLKTTRQSAHTYERAYVINRDGTLEEIPTGISVGSYYAKVKAGGVAVEYNGMNGDKPYRTVAFYGGKTLPDMTMSTEEDEDF